MLDHLPNGERTAALGYDTLIVAGGSRYSYFGHDEWQAHAPELKSLAGALEIRSRILAAFEAAEVETRPGAAAGLADLRRRRRRPDRASRWPGRSPSSRTTRCARDFRSADTRTARVLLVEAADRVLTSFPESLSRKAARALERLGVTPLVGHTSSTCTPTRSRSGTRTARSSSVAARTVVWAAGVTASELAAELAERGRPRRRPGRPAHRRARPHPPRTPRGVRARRHGQRAGRRRHDHAAARASPRRDAAGPLRRARDPRPPTRPGARPVPLRRQGQPRHDRALEGGRRREGSAPRRASPPGRCGSSSTSST